MRIPVWEKNTRFEFRKIVLCWWHWVLSHIRWFLAGLSIAAWIIPHYLLVYGHQPPVGVYVAIMGAVIALMSLRKEPPIWENFLWIILVTFLMVAEIRDIYVTDGQQVQKFDAISKSLEATKTGLQNAASDLKDIGGQIKTQSDTSQTQFETTLSEVKQSIAAVTGGDTYCVVGAAFRSTDFALVATAQGKNPLHEVNVDLVDLDIERKVKIFSPEAIDGFTTHLRIPFLAPTREHTGQQLAAIPVGNTGERNLRFNFFSINGAWGENLNLRLVGGQWVEAIKITKQTKDNKQRTLYINIPDSYPKVDGKVDW